jgi:hypothetical protein
VRLLEVTVGLNGTTTRLSGRIEQKATGERVDAYVEYAADPGFVGNGPDAFAAAMLLPAMRAGEMLRIDPPISPRLCLMLPRIRDIFHTWWPNLARVDIDATPADVDRRTPPNRAATFFSGGVDSFYTLLKHLRGGGTLPAPMTHLIFVRGVETRLSFIRGADQTEAWVREVAATTGTSVIVGETNFRTALQRSEDYLHWERHYHGSALAAVALGLSPGLAFACIPSAFSYNHLVAHGSTPLVDEMFSTEQLQVVHDGSEVNRPAKVARIIEWDRTLVLNHLRVCIENRGGAKNCGRCKKCVRTAVPLRVLGVWEQADTFPDKRSDHWRGVMVGDHLVLTEENLKFARERDADPALIAMLRSAIRRKRRRERLKALFDNPPLDQLRPVVLRTRDYLSSRSRVRPTKQGV